MIVGIDPGVTGAVAFFDPDKSPASGLRWVVEDMPVVGDPAELNAPALRDLLCRFNPEHAFLEQVNAMPVIVNRATGARGGMGATSAFRFGGMYFGIKAIVACCDIPLTTVRPQAWKKLHGLAGPDKEADRQRALELFPDQVKVLSRKKDHNRSNAMLIASYGAATLGYEIPNRSGGEALRRLGRSSPKPAHQV